jgi:chromosome segregation ATPase
LPKDRIEDEVLRIKSHGRYSKWGGLEIKAKNRGAIESYIDIIERDIEEIGTVDKAKAEQLQRSYNNLAEKIAGLDAKDASLKKEIILLHSKGKEKVLSGFNDKEEFEKARKIFEKRNSLFVEIYPQVEKFSHVVWRIHRDCGFTPGLLR